MKNLLLVFLLLTGLNLYSQRRDARQNEFILNIELDDAGGQIIKSVDFRYYDHVFTATDQPKYIIPLQDSSNNFQFKINMKDKIGYFNLPVPELSSLHAGFFIVCSGDSVTLHFKGNNAVFTGRGASKLNYQLWMSKRLIQYSAELSKPGLEIDLVAKRKVKSNLIAEFTDSIGRYKAQWGDSVSKILKLNSLSIINSCYMDIEIYKNAGRDTLSTLIAELENVYAEQSLATVNEDYAVQYAYLYPFYIHNLNKYYAKWCQNGKTPAFEQQYHNLLNTYSGSLRDALLAYAFMEAPKGDTIRYSYVPAALKVITNPYYYQLVDQLNKHKQPGTKAYNFSLVGVNGKKVTLNDFKGKMIVVDVWFTGCMGCIGLAERMKPVISRFKNNKNVVFLSVCADKDKKTFLTSVKSGVYGSRDLIHTYTGGLGTYHPMLLHYQYRGYPNLLIIDKNGLVISANPPKPRDQKTLNELIKLIENNLL